MLTPHPLALKLKLPNFNNKTLSEANASLFFIKKLCKKLQSFVLVCSRLLNAVNKAVKLGH